MANKIEFSPAIPIPLVFDVQKRIQELRGYLDPKNPLFQPKQQHDNIKAAIKLYEDGKIDGLQEVHIMEGKVVTREEMFKGSAWAWGEGMHHQFAQKFAYDHGPFGPYCHELRMLLRLMPQRGGDGTVHGIIAMNDTGSSILTLFDTDMPHVGNIQAYAGWRGQTAVRNANGTIDVYPQILVQVQLVRDDNSPWSDWIDELAIVKPARAGVARLSGIGIRDILYFGTAPGNHSLAVSATKVPQAGTVQVPDLQRKGLPLCPLANPQCNGGYFSPEPSYPAEGIEAELGLPHYSAKEPELAKKADTAILSRFPRLKDQPPRNVKYKPLPLSTDLKSKHRPNQPYRLYRFTVPSSSALFHARSIAFAGAYMSVSTVTVAQVQALWIAAYFGNDIPNLGSKSSYADSKIEWNTVLHSQFGKWRHPAAAGGYGERFPDMAFDSLPFVDLLLKDLGLPSHRKGGWWWREWFVPYNQGDYKGLVLEWEKSREKPAKELKKKKI